MPYYPELLYQAFDETWDLVVAKPFTHLGVAGVTSILTFLLLRRLNRDEEIKKRLRDYTVAGSAFAAVFVFMFLLHTLVLTPKHLVEQARRETDGQRDKLQAAQKAKEVAEKERDDAKADLLAATKAAPPGSAAGTETALAHKREVADKIAEFLRDGERSCTKSKTQN